MLQQSNLIFYIHKILCISSGVSSLDGVKYDGMMSIDIEWSISIIEISRSDIRMEWTGFRGM